MTDETPPRSALASPWLTAVLLLAALVLGSLAALEAYDDRSRTSAAPAPALGEKARTRLQDLAARSAEDVLTYGHDTFDEDVEATARRLTPEFAVDYAAGMQRVRADTLADRIDQQAAAVAAGVASATDARADVLVFVNQETTSGTTGARRVERNRLVVRLVRQGGAWSVAGVTALG